MVRLDSGNVLLKPSHRKQLMSSLRRSSKIGERLGNFDLTIKLSRVGNQHQAMAMVKDAAGDFMCKARKRDWRGALRELVQSLVHRLHDQDLSSKKLA